MLKRLESETAGHHAGADEPRLALLSTAVGPSEYRAFLVRTYAHEAPVEASLMMTPEIRDVIDLRGRTRLKLLKSDLRSVGIPDPSRIPVHRRARPFRSAGEALGWMYVLERNTRIHGLLRRHLERKLPEQMKSAGTYLGSERSSGSRWAELGTVLDDVATAGGCSNEIVSAAQAAFRYQLQGAREDVPAQLVRVA